MLGVVKESHTGMTEVSAGNPNNTVETCKTIYEDSVNTVTSHLHRKDPHGTKDTDLEKPTLESFPSKND